MKRYRTVRALHEAYRVGETTPLAYTESLLAEAESDHYERGTFTAILRDRALAEANASSERWAQGTPLGLFDGVPLVWKDLFDIAGTRTTASSLAYLDSPLAKEDAAAVAFYSAQGGINLAKVGLSEFAYSALGINPGLGTPANAAISGERRISGGSSSGTAVAVKKGLVSVGMGTDTSGSIRIPAAFQGLYGYKPSGDFYRDTAGIMPLSTTLDTFGPIAASLQDCYDLYCLFAQQPPQLLEQILAERSDGEVPLRYCVPTNIFKWEIDQDVLDCFEQLLLQLEGEGYTIERIDVPAIDAVADIMDRYGTFAAAESSYYHRALLQDERRQKIHPRVLSRMARANSMSAVDYLTLKAKRSEILALMREQYSSTIFLMPTVAMEAPLLAPLEVDDEAFFRENLRAMRLTVVGNFLAWDSITLPMGFGDEGLPLGLMVSNNGSDPDLLFDETAKIDRLIQERSKVDLFRSV